MTDTPAHPWLEDDEFEGVGAHRDNPRYDPVDEDGFDDVTGEPIPGWVKPDNDAVTAPLNDAVAPQNDAVPE